MLKLCINVQLHVTHQGNMGELAVIKQLDDGSWASGTREQYQVTCVQGVLNTTEWHSSNLRWWHYPIPEYREKHKPYNITLTMLYPCNNKEGIMCTLNPEWYIYTLNHLKKGISSMTLFILLQPPTTCSSIINRHPII